MYGIFNNCTFASENSLVLICSYGDLNCSVPEFLEALKEKNLLSSVWGVTRHFSNKHFEFALHNSDCLAAFLNAEITVKGCVLSFRRKVIPKIHVLLQNIPIGFLRNGCSSAIALLAKHLSKGRGKVDSYYCQKVNVEGEDICTGNVIVVISDWKNPSQNPLPRYENVDGLTLRYIHRGQPESHQQTLTSNSKTSTPEEENRNVKATSEEKEFKESPSASEETEPLNSEEIVSRPFITRKRHGGRKEKKSPKKSIQRNSITIVTNENKNTDTTNFDESKLSTEIYSATGTSDPPGEEDADLSFEEED